MSVKVKAVICASIFVALTTAALAAAGNNVPAHRPPVNALSRPASLWEVYYTRLKGSREFCYLPSEPCDNSHRVVD
jgi:hypothetical protein